MDSVTSLGLFVGTGQCNAYCKHCAGKPLRQYAPKKDGDISSDLFYETIKKCYEEGARSLTLTSSGEPTLSPLSVTKTLELICDMRKDNIQYQWINLYSNGIVIGRDKEFSCKYLPLWHKLGLQTIYITVHNIDEKKNANIYGIKNYPSLNKVVSRIHSAGLLARANVVLTKDNIGTCKEYVFMVKGLREIGFDHISAWPIRNLDDKMDLKLAPLEEELDKMESWAQKQETPNCRLRVLRENTRTAYRTGRKLTLFPNNTLSTSWCN